MPITLVLHLKAWVRKVRRYCNNSDSLTTVIVTEYIIMPDIINYARCEKSTPVRCDGLAEAPSEMTWPDLTAGL